MLLDILLKHERNPPTRARLFHLSKAMFSATLRRRAAPGFWSKTSQEFQRAAKFGLSHRLDLPLFLPACVCVPKLT